MRHTTRPTGRRVGVYWYASCSNPQGLVLAPAPPIPRILDCRHRCPMVILKLALVFALLSAASFAAGFFLTKYLVDSHYIAI
jgi:hypothetical protein